jgi:hypothetical protein
MTATVIALGRTRSTAPVRIASLSCCSLRMPLKKIGFAVHVQLLASNRTT